MPIAESRMNDNRHYLHDVLAGMTIGMAYGVGLSSLYKTHDQEIPVPGNQTTSSHSTSKSSTFLSHFLPVYEPSKNLSALYFKASF